MPVLESCHAARPASVTSNFLHARVSDELVYSNRSKSSIFSPSHVHILGWIQPTIQKLATLISESNHDLTDLIEATSQTMDIDVNVNVDT